MDTLYSSDSDDSVFTSWPLFKTLIDSLFENTYYLEQVYRNFHILKQKGFAHNTSIEFKTFTSILKLKEDAKISEYKKRLKDGIKKEIAYTAEIMNFDLLVVKSIKINQVLFEINKMAKKEDLNSQKPTSTSMPSQFKNFFSFSQSSQLYQALYIRLPSVSSSPKSQAPCSLIY